MFGLKDKVVIVTGASSGIGAALAQQLCQEGANVTIIGRNVEKLNKTYDDCKKIQAARVLKIVGDITVADDAERIVNETVKCFGKIDVLVNNAGFGLGTPITDAKAMEAFDNVMNTNIRAVVHLTHLTVPWLEKTKGNIVNVSSVAALKALPNSWTYCTAKAALDHFSRCMALDLGPKGIRVNVVTPGPVKTDFLLNMGLTPEQVEISQGAVAKATLLDRSSDPSEIGELIVFLISEKARGITGSCFVSDNGMMQASPTF